MAFVGLFQKRLINTVGEGLDPPGGKGCDILSISAKTNRVHGRVKTLPYSKNEMHLKICKGEERYLLSLPLINAFHIMYLKL